MTRKITLPAYIEHNDGSIQFYGRVNLEAKSLVEVVCAEFGCTPEQIDFRDEYTLEFLEGEEG